MSYEENIKVYCRIRPLKNEEKLNNNVTEIAKVLNSNTIEFINPSNPLDNIKYQCTKVYSPSSSEEQQIEIYQDTTKPILLSALNGINGSLIAYGQTSSGKTYTMNSIKKYLFQEIFNLDNKLETKIFLAYYEIYNEKINDLIRPNKILDRVNDVEVTNKTEVDELMAIGDSNRKQGHTDMNELSSRSHSILKIVLRTRNNDNILTGTIFVVDLAGSENIAKS